MYLLMTDVCAVFIFIQRQIVTAAKRTFSQVEREAGDLEEQADTSGSQVSKKRTRESRFMDCEKDLLCCAICENYEVLFRSKASASTKKQIWERIELEVSSQSVTPREVKQIQHRWHDTRREMESSVMLQMLWRKEFVFSLSTEEFPSELVQDNDTQTPITLDLIEVVSQTQRAEISAAPALDKATAACDLAETLIGINGLNENLISEIVMTGATQLVNTQGTQGNTQ
ncbi:uncharacterized protein LOC115087280 [Rhinatrema bivittatum]|uniref:uncharacterized protein LOC115087280 n=1 Tax=Rhinatrema bivittatum TaxID=194408 RepID=UPI00112785C1|nr:uncharacterized protein LOC115087280 [Rhinatrema bivittatum]